MNRNRISFRILKVNYSANNTILNLFEFKVLNKKSPTFVEDLIRGEDGIRTHDLLTASQAL